MTVVAVLPTLRVETYKPHPLHDLARSWPETNCYVDVWIEVLSSLGFEPAAAAAFTLTQDFEGDQFTFFKFSPDDLELLFGLTVHELAIYDSVEAHAVEQIKRGRLPLVEVDSFFLPDTAGLSYKIDHTKTTIGINRLDIGSRRIEYFHNGGYFAAIDDDFDGLFRRGPFKTDASALFPYVEFVKRGTAPSRHRLAKLARDRLAHHFARRPQSDPFVAFQAAMPSDIERLIAGGDFHKYAFNTVRQFGANFSLLAAHLTWLDASGILSVPAANAAAVRVSEAAKVLQFQIARSVARKQSKGLERGLDKVIDDYEVIIDSLSSALSDAPLPALSS